MVCGGNLRVTDGCSDRFCDKSVVMRVIIEAKCSCKESSLASAAICNFR